MAWTGAGQKVNGMGGLGPYDSIPKKSRKVKQMESQTLPIDLYFTFGLNSPPYFSSISFLDFSLIDVVYVPRLRIVIGGFSYVGV